jgi:H+/Cl- antiporter ClcA
MNDHRGDFAANSRVLRITSLALVIGAVCGFVALALLRLIALFTSLFYYHEVSFVTREPTLEVWGMAAILVPVVGGLIIGLMARYGSEKIRGHGIPEALEAILFGKSLMNAKVAILKPLSSAVSIGSGGPFGAEGPIIMTGGAFGSLFAQWFHLTSSERKTLLVAGAAAGMTAVFATPVSAILLAVELLLFEWRPRSLIPVAAACAVSAAIRPALLGDGPLFPVLAHAALPASSLGWAALVGLIAGLFATGVSRALYALEDGFAKLPIHWMWWPALGGLVVGIGGWFEPRALGVGYSLIQGLLRGEFSPHAVLGLVSVKALIWVFALASGTSGGVLAPLLIMGASLGVIESVFIPGGSTVWPLVSMAAILGGMMRSPFTAILFAIELSHDLDSLQPLMVASFTAYTTTVILMKRSILTEKIARRGYDLFREYGVDPLERLRVKEAMTASPETIPAAVSAREARERWFSGRHKHRGYPVVDGQGKVTGVLTQSDFLNDSLEVGSRDSKAQDLVRGVPLIAGPEESCRAAAERMAMESIGRLPVVDPKTGACIGILTRSDLMKALRQDLEQEQKRERFASLK